MRTLQISALAAAATLSLSAQAAPTFYSSEADFATATAGITLTTETFDTYNNRNAVSSITNLTSGLNISSNTYLYDENNTSNCAGSSKGNCISFDTPWNGSSQLFTFDSGAINAFGLFLGDLATVGQTLLTLTTSTGATKSYTLNSSSSGNERYFGVLDLDATFTSVRLQNSDYGDTVYIDNVSWGKGNVVPEPGILAMLGLGLAGMAMVRRRQA